MPLLHIYIYFILYSFLGWVCESIYCSIGEHKLINRGFVNGPFCPIYGFGALAILQLLSPITNNVVAIFLAATIITSAIEYISGYLLEKTFNTQWWDYSNYPFNIQGRICLKNSLLFGILSTLLHFVIHPFMSREVATFSSQYLLGFATLFTLLFLVDATHTVYTVLKLNDKLTTMENLGQELVAKSVEMGQELGLENLVAKVKSLSQKASFPSLPTMPSLPNFSGSEELLQRFKDKLESLEFAELRLIRAFPKMRNLKNPYVQTIRDFINDKTSNNDKSA